MYLAITAFELRLLSHHTIVRTVGSNTAKNVDIHLKKYFRMKDHESETSSPKLS